MLVVYLLSVLFLLGVLGTGFSFMSVLAKLGLEHSTYRSTFLVSDPI